MVAKLTTLASMVAIVSIMNTPANAEHHNARYRNLDNISFAAFVEARELRWELHDDFVDSADYEHLLEDADEVIEALHDLQSTIYRERPDRVIAREAAIVQKKLSSLTTHLNGCDFARVSHSRRTARFNGRGYVFAPETRNVGRAHVVAALKMVSRIESALSSLEREVRPVHHQRSQSNIVPPVFEEAPRPEANLPAWEFNNRNRRFLEIPVGNPGKSGFVFKIGY